MKLTLSESEILEACIQWAKDYKSTNLHNPRLVHDVDHDGTVNVTTLEADLEPPKAAPAPTQRKR